MFFRATAWVQVLAGLTYMQCESLYWQAKRSSTFRFSQSFLSSIFAPSGAEVSMKTRVFDPFAAVHESGGCTFEPESGWWTQLDSERDARRLGTPFADSRDALYIPTLQKDGTPVAHAVVETLKARSRSLGLVKEICAAGMWVLSGTGEVQTETIWIFAGKCRNRNALHALAYAVRQLATQDCVAWEEQGCLNFTGAEPAEVAA